MIEAESEIGDAQFAEIFAALEEEAVVVGRG